MNLISCVQFLAISKEEADDAVTRGQLPYNGYSEEFLDRLEPNGNIPSNKERCYGIISILLFFIFVVNFSFYSFD